MKRMNFSGRKEIRRDEAIARNKAWSARHLADKIDELFARPGKCLKQLGKLYKMAA